MRSPAFFLLFLLFSCSSPEPAKELQKEKTDSLMQVPASKKTQENSSAVSLVILGTVQDGGSPHPGCEKACCRALFSHPDTLRKVVCLGIVDRVHKKTYLLEATPDLPSQLRLLRNYSGFKDNDLPDGIFLTHAHIGHYAGLMYLGREAMGASNVNVYAMPRMKHFLETDGPWSQLVKLKNISLSSLREEQEVVLSDSLKITPFLVPHRDEYSETVGYKVEGPGKKLLFIPDIDKWSKWKKNIVEEIKKVDYAFIDATFFWSSEVGNRDMSEIPHPFVVESRELFESLPETEKNKIYFIHFNHTNPLLDRNTQENKAIQAGGYHVAAMGTVLPL